MKLVQGFDSNYRFILVAARRLVVKRLKKPDPGAAQRKELHLPRLGGDADGGSGGEPPTRWTSPVAADADSTDLFGEVGADEPTDSEAAAPEAPPEWTVPVPVEPTEVRPAEGLHGPFHHARQRPGGSHEAGIAPRPRAAAAALLGTVSARGRRASAPSSPAADRGPYRTPAGCWSPW